MSVELSYGICDLACYECDHPFTHRRKCDEQGCEGGFIDGHSLDPLNFAESEAHCICSCCSGTGFEWWCPECQTDLNHARHSLEFMTRVGDE